MKTWKIFLFMALLLGIFFSPFAASSPDGLEKVAIDYGFIEKEMIVHLAAPFPDYRLGAITNEKLSTAFCGLIGTGVTFALCLIVGQLMLTKK